MNPSWKLPAMTPTINTMYPRFDPMFTTGTIAVRAFNGAYPLACWMAWPASCAAIAAAAMLLVP